MPDDLNLSILCPVQKKYRNDEEGSGSQEVGLRITQTQKQIDYRQSYIKPKGEDRLMNEGTHA